MTEISAAIRDTLKICQELKDMKMPIKEFVTTFLTGKHIELATRRRFWATNTGYKSTLSLVECIWGTFEASADGQGWWEEFIQQEAIRILVRNNHQLSRSSTGHFESANLVKPDFFSEAAKARQEEKVVHEEMPFLYGILMGMLNNGNEPDPPSADVDESMTHTPNEPISVPNDTYKAQLLERDGITYVSNPGDRDEVSRRRHHLAATICAQLLFSCNRRHNGLQLHNAIRFLPCGVSERVNEYLHMLGLTSSRLTAIEALKTLSAHAAEDIKAVKSLDRSPDLGPFLCIDNLDIEEKVHMASITNQSMMFHGTWGYVQLPSKALLESLDKSELNLGAYKKAIQDVPNMQINPSVFLPSHDNEQHYSLVMKSQIAQVMDECVGFLSDKEGAISTNPPVLEQILAEVPTVFMLRLMDESDNSAKGIGQVLESIQRQTGLTPSKFASWLQPMDGDLATIQNFNALRDLRYPSSYPENSLDNIVFQLGGAHTLWNIAQAILMVHLGNPSSKKDLGVWQYFEALGIPHEKVIQKKDFTLMLRQIELVHKATLLHCIREAAQDKSSRLHNVLVRLHDFSTIIEGNNAMQAGDIGRLMNVWKMWAVMSQAIKSLKHYSAYLPSLIFLLTKALLPSQSKLLKHNILMSPSGRPDQFMAKDHFMEHQNFWLKSFFNSGGIGTQVDRLKKLFLMNIFLLRSMFHSLRVDSGKKKIHQNRKTLANYQSLQMFCRMANNRDILGLLEPEASKNETKTVNVYLQGIKNFRSEIRNKDASLGRLKLHFPKSALDVIHNDDEGGDNEEEDNGPEM
ncbi:hypothetical protein PCASD_16050 [Puccinia coronata f. sp. avenae]|uniref:DUF6589 domain-containing protein n=1 Tax=Puccinia coronata f. sp. avenae TaxID=200324 RepID=A0A2N5U003_9BASI|nr:hypothetical protein PCASD_16050 [Puccinia coronata f. sp. avenae]